MMSEKLQKVLARTGMGSRRELETWISAGRVSVNGSVAKLGDRVTNKDLIRVDGRIVNTPKEEEIARRIIMYHKPAGEVCSRNDPQGRPTVFENLPRLRNLRWVLVGRLDINTSGLLLFTTDGELAHRLMHPSNEFVREYAVRVRGRLTPEQQQALLTGVELEDGISKFATLEEAGGGEESLNQWYKVTLLGGKYREVRRLFGSQGLEVSRLIRIRFGDLKLPPQLRLGRWAELDASEVEEIANSVQLKSKQYTGLYGRARLRAQRPGGRQQRPPRTARRPQVRVRRKKR